jgi:hypothetical protein
VTVVLTRAPRHTPLSFPLVGDAIVFADDVADVGGMLRAVFEVDVFQQVGVAPESGTYFVSACLRGLLSNVVRVEVGG